MNTKAVMAIILAIASAAGIVAVAEAQDVEAGSSVQMGTVVTLTVTASEAQDPLQDKPEGEETGEETAG